jgi:4-hydroxybenzoate polyprenyltransferase
MTDPTTIPAGALPRAAPGGRVRTWASFVRFEHTLFSLPLILAGIFSVAGPPMPGSRWAWIALAAVGARTAAMGLAEAWALLLGSAAAYLVACWALDPAQGFYLKVAPIPLAVFTIYPLLKRITPLCHFGVGAGLGLAPLAGWAAAHPKLDLPGPATWLALFAFFWVSGFDIIYSTLDEAFDRVHGVRSMVVWLGRKRALAVSGALHVLAFACLLLAVLHVMESVLIHHPAPGRLTAAMGATLGLLVVAAALLLLEQKWAEDVNLAFFKVNVWVGLVVLLATVAPRFAG